MASQVRSALALLGASAGIAACGGGGSPRSAAGLFQRDCQVCHSITGRPSASQQGGDLRGVSLPRSELAQYIAEMPVPNAPLTRGQVWKLAGYLQSVERRR